LVASPCCLQGCGRLLHCHVPSWMHQCMNSLVGIGVITSTSIPTLSAGPADCIPLHRRYQDSCVANTNCISKLHKASSDTSLHAFSPESRMVAPPSCLHLHSSCPRNQQLTARQLHAPHRLHRCCGQPPLTPGRQEAGRAVR
jgi:hypothetical protein